MSTKATIWGFSTADPDWRPKLGPPDFCPGCGTEHHWLACPEVSQSVFPHDPEWDAEEPPPPMVANVDFE